MAELRRHPVSDEWVVICPEKSPAGSEANSDGCIFCPGKEALTGSEVYRVSGRGDLQGPAWRVRVVAESPPLFHVEGGFSKKAAGLCDCMEAIGAHEVLLDSPSHDQDLESLDEDQIISILEVIRARAVDLGGDERLRQMLVFKIRVAGSHQHPRWHIVSTPFVPRRIKEELKGAAKYYSYKERCVFCDYIRQELESGLRVIGEDSGAVAISPYAARFPYETWILPTAHSPDFKDVGRQSLPGIARLLRGLAGAMMRLPDSRGYVLSLNTAPFRKPKPGSWKTIALDYHWRFEIKPRVNLLNGLKESGGFHLNPVTPEAAAEILRQLR